MVMLAVIRRSGFATRRQQINFPTIARTEQLIAEKRIFAGRPVAGRISLRLMVEADSLEHVDRIISSLPLWPVAETRVTPLIAFADRRNHVQAFLDGLVTKSSQQAEGWERSSRCLREPCM
jgi:hypothetical protein